MKLNVRVKPNSKQQRIEEVEGGLVVRLISSPIDGKANDELVDLLSKKFSVKKSQVAIRMGATSRNKLIEILNT